MSPSPLLLATETVAAGGACFAATAWVSIYPTSSFWGRVHARGVATTSSEYALTFDDGPTRNSTERILDVLGELRVPAAFFVIGDNARRSPDLLARMHAEGHIVANHSLDHAHFSMFRGKSYWDRQLRETDRIIEEVISVRPAMFRPPMGVRTSFVMGAAARHGHAVITWTRRAVDGITTTSQRILNRLVPRTAAGDVLILHDGVEPRSRRKPEPTVAALRPLIRQLRERGLEPARLDRLLNLPAYSTARTESAAH